MHCLQHRTAMTPEHIVQGEDGRWYHDGIDVTDMPLRWRCADGHAWQATLGHRTSGEDRGCPPCAAYPQLALF